MLTFDTPGGRFSVRVAGLATHGTTVLLHTTAGDDFWALPGGRVEFGEAGAETLRREMREELGLEVEVGGLLSTLENFFAYRGRRYQEICLIFAMTLPPSAPAARHGAEFPGIEDGGRLRFAWIDLAPDAGWTGAVKPDVLLALRTAGRLPAHAVIRDASSA